MIIQSISIIIYRFYVLFICFIFSFLEKSVCIYNKQGIKVIFKISFWTESERLQSKILIERTTNGFVQQFEYSLYLKTDELSIVQNKAGYNLRKFYQWMYEQEIIGILYKYRKFSMQQTKKHMLEQINQKFKVSFYYL